MRPHATTIVVDAETYYADDYSLRNAGMTTSRYIRDARFEEIGWSVLSLADLPPEADMIADERRGLDPYAPVRKQWVTPEEFGAMCRHTDWSRAAVVAHHAHFDGLIMREKHAVERCAWWYDTLSMVRYAVGASAGASLDEALPHFGLGRKDNFLAAVKNKRRRDFSREEWLRFGRYGAVDAIGTARLLRKLLADFPPSQLDAIDLAVRKFVEPVLLADEPMLRGFAEFERARRERVLAGLGLEQKIFGSSNKFAELLRSLGVEPPMKDSPKKVGEDGRPERIYAFAKSDAGMQDLLEYDDADEDLAALVRSCAEMRLMAKSTQSVSRAERFLELGRDGAAIPVYMKPCATHTLRMAGGDGANFANLERVRRSKEYPDGLPNSGVLRKSLVAPPGMKLVVVDSSQIEPRKTAWVFGEERLLGMFRERRDVYSEVASDLYGRKIDRKRNLDDFLPGHVGKVCVLGLNYQMSGPRLGAEMLRGAQGGPRMQFDRAFADQIGARPEDHMKPWFVERVSEMPTRLSLADMLVHCATAQHIVNRYRATFIPNVVENGWRFCQDVVLPAMLGGAEVRFGPGGFLRTAKNAILAPSGERLEYHALERVVDGKRIAYKFMKARSTPEWTHGGKVVENIIQWLSYLTVIPQVIAARERAFAEGLWWYVPMTSYDEGVFCVPEDEAELCLQVVEEEFRVPPAWAPDLPLACEAHVADRYGDAK